MTSFTADLTAELTAIRDQSLWKTEREIISSQSAHIGVTGGREVLNFCANNYLGLANHPKLIEAAKAALDSHGFGMASVRFICGTTDLHRQLEARIADYVGMEDSILFAACFDANGAVFEPLFGEQDAIISDALNHASIIDGIRLSKAKRFRFANGDMADLETQLQAAKSANARRIIIVTDGVFSMDGYFADLKSIRSLADRYDALIMVDDCHATGFVGPQGRGTPQRAGIKVDILTGTLGKALGGSAGGYIAASRPVVDLMRQRARPYLFSNALPPAIVAASLAAIDMAETSDDLRGKLARNASHFRSAMTAQGFTLLPGEHPIIPVMLGEAQLAQAMASELYAEGIYVTGFFFPVVPKGKARIRTQMSAAHSTQDIDMAVEAFSKVGRKLGSDRMKALVKAAPEEGLVLRDEAVPEIGADDILIKVAKTGICGTDLHIWKWDQWAQKTIPVPMVVGHEFAGVVVDVGNHVRTVKVGDRVSGEGHLIGMKSRMARAGHFHLDPETKGVGVNVPGAFAEFLKIPAFNAIHLPPDVDDEIGAILDPLGNAVHTALSFDLIGEDVLITGAGPIGIMAASVCRHVGARHVVITDVNDYRLELCNKVNDAVTVNVAREDLRDVMAKLNMQEGFDIGLEMSGAPGAFDQMVDHMIMGGKIAMLGIPAKATPVDWNNIIFKSLTIKGIYGREMFETWYKMIAMLQSGLDVRNVITHRFKASDYAKGFELMKQGQSGKVVLDWV